MTISLYNPVSLRRPTTTRICDNRSGVFYPMACSHATATTHQLCDVAQALRQDYERFDRRVPVAEQFQHLLQLEERMGFVHAFRPLGADETRHILACQRPQLGIICPDEDCTDAEAIAAIIRNTGDNFRLLHRNRSRRRRRGQPGSTMSQQAKYPQNQYVFASATGTPINP